MRLHFSRAFSGSTRLQGRTTSTKTLNSQRFLCSGGKRLENIFVLHFSPVSIQFDMIAVVHTSGYAVIQVMYRRDINLKLSVFLQFV